MNSVVSLAETWIGTGESGTNVVPGITDREGINGQAWCAAFVRVVMEDAGVTVPEGAGYYCPYWIKVAVDAGQSIPLDQGQPGDIVLFSWSAWYMHDGYPWTDVGSYSGIAGDHVGILASAFDGNAYDVIEGNTRSDYGGDQGEGDGVYRKRRDLSTICCIWRLPGADRGNTPELVEDRALGWFAPASTPPDVHIDEVCWGLDLSEWQPPDQIPWQTFRAAGLAFVIVRLGDGTLIDSAAQQHIAGARAAGVPYITSYWFARDSEDVRVQTRRYIELAARYGLDEPPICDWEHGSRQNGDPNWLAEAVALVAESAPDERKIPYYADWYGLRDLAACPPANGVWWCPGGTVYDSPLKPSEAVAQWRRRIEDLPNVPVGIWQATQKGRVPGYAGDLDINVSTRTTILELLGQEGDEMTKDERDLLAAAATNAADACVLARNLGEQMAKVYTDVMARLDAVAGARPSSPVEVPLAAPAAPVDPSVPSLAAGWTIAATKEHTAVYAVSPDPVAFAAALSPRRKRWIPDYPTLLRFAGRPDWQSIAHTWPQSALDEIPLEGPDWHNPPQPQHANLAPYTGRRI